MAGKRSTVWAGNQFTLTYAAIKLGNGKAEDQWLSIEQDEDDVTYTQGMDGEGVFNEQLSTGTTVTFRCLQTSSDNNVLSAYHITSKKAGVLPGPIYIEDRKGNTKFLSDAAVISKTPALNVARQVGQVEWVFKVHDPENFVGGH